MATRQSVDELMQKCEDAINYANEQYNEASRQEHYNNVDYTEAMQQLEQAYNDLAHLALSANDQQRDRLHRMRLRLQQTQNDLTLLDR